jgi:crotonobetainyl-CoA:carnitine CoA-transferase CaiB-like acyl-CoA transferase
MTGDAGRDLNYLAASGILAKFRRNHKSTEFPFPGNFLTYYAGGSIYTFNLILQAMLQNNEKTVIESSLTLNLTYTAQPVLLDAYMTGPFFKPLEGTPKAKNDFTNPEYCIYKC